MRAYVRVVFVVGDGFIVCVSVLFFFGGGVFRVLFGGHILSKNIVQTLFLPGTIPLEQSYRLPPSV